MFPNNSKETLLIIFSILIALLLNQNIKYLNPREGYYILNRQSTESRQNVENEVFESMNVVQGKLVLGLNVDFDDENLQAIALVYNAILGDGANSMMFQNVREKESLAYSARSNYIKQKLHLIIQYTNFHYIVK